MDPKKVVKQTFDFYKSTFENTYNAMTMLQEQNQKMVEMYLDQTQGFPEEGKKAVQEWIKAYKKGGEIVIRADVGVGTASATVWTCDLTHDYVSINADYRS